MTWERLRGKMSEGLSLNIPQMDFFDKSPAHTPSQVLNSLDLLSAEGTFVPSNGSHSSFQCTPTMSRRFKTQSDELLRRKSLMSDVVYDHTISDEFSHISLTIKERRHSNVSRGSTPELLPAPKRVIYTQNISNDNQIIIAKVLADEGEEDAIEIIDLDDDEEYRSSHRPVQMKEDLYPNCDVNVWLRSCEQEIADPIGGVISGTIPEWLNGSLLRNGPGSIKVGDQTFKHLFDASALLHRFNIENGQVTYQCKFLKSESYKKNLAANRIVVSEFGTACVPDPCQSIFER